MYQLPQQKRNSYVLKTCSSGQQSMDQEDLTVWGRHIQHADELSAAGEAVSCCTNHQTWVIVNNQCIVNGGLAERRLHSCAVEKSTEKSQLVKIKHTSNSTNTQAKDVSRKIIKHHLETIKTVILYSHKHWHQVLFILCAAVFYFPCSLWLFPAMIEFISQDMTWSLPSSPSLLSVDMALMLAAQAAAHLPWDRLCHWKTNGSIQAWGKASSHRDTAGSWALDLSRRCVSHTEYVSSELGSFLFPSLQVPTPEIRAHSLYFDLSAYGVEALREHRNHTTKPGFHLKIYGTFRNRYMALICPTSDSKMVRFLRHTANSSVSLLSCFWVMLHDYQSEAPLKLF